MVGGRGVRVIVTVGVAERNVGVTVRDGVMVRVGVMVTVGERVIVGAGGVPVTLK